jgi:hypothetical protein
MDASISCPRCGAHLRLPEHADPAATSFRCPRCQGAVPVPGRQPLFAGVTQLPESTRVPGQPEGREQRCPSCAQIVQPSWVSCPGCGKSLREQPPRAGPHSGETNLRLNQPAVGRSTILLAVLGVGLLIWVLCYTTFYLGSSMPEVLVGLLPPLLLVFAFFFLNRPQAERSLGLAVVRTLATIGALGALTTALMILMLAVCYSIFGPGMKPYGSPGGGR